jgi:putative hef-like homing endonuclease
MSEIVDETGLSIYLVKKLLNENGIELPLRLSPDYSEHRKLYLSGLTISEVSLKLGCTKNIVRKAIAGLPRHSQSEAIKSFIKRNPRTPKPYVCPFEHLEDIFVEEYKLGKPTSKIAEDHGCSTHIVLKYLRKNNIDCKRFTQPERAISYILNKHDVEHEVHNRTIIKPKELDIWIPSKNIAIEVNGLFWHSSIKESNRHKNKFLMCLETGITLLQFTDYDIRTRFDMVESIILQTLGITQIINSDDCLIVEIDNAKEFFNNNYYGDHVNSETAGLVYNNEIVMAMSFSNNKIVYTSKLFHNIEGGFQKLEHYFIEKYKPEALISNSIALVDDGITLLENGYKLSSISEPEKYFTNGWRIGVGKRIYSGAGIIEYRKELA